MVMGRYRDCRGIMYMESYMGLGFCFGVGGLWQPQLRRLATHNYHITKLKFFCRLGRPASLAIFTHYAYSCDVGLPWRDWKSVNNYFCGESVIGESFGSVIEE